MNAGQTPNAAKSSPPSHYAFAALRSQRLPRHHPIALHDAARAHLGQRAAPAVGRKRDDAAHSGVGRPEHR
jgi:hypothetical protein